MSNPYYTQEELDRQRRFSKNAAVRHKFGLEYREVQQLFGEEKAFALSRADIMYSPGDVEKIKQYRQEHPGTRW